MKNISSTINICNFIARCTILGAPLPVPFYYSGYEPGKTDAIESLQFQRTTLLWTLHNVYLTPSAKQPLDIRGPSKLIEIEGSDEAFLGFRVGATGVRIY